MKYNSYEVATVTREYLRERAELMEPGTGIVEELMHRTTTKGGGPRGQLFQVLTEMVVLAPSENEVSCRVPATREGLAHVEWASRALEYVDKKLNLDGEIIHNAPEEYLLAW
jgi:hypothetical protein